MFYFLTDIDIRNAHICIYANEYEILHYIIRCISMTTLISDKRKGPLFVWKGKKYLFRIHSVKKLHHSSICKAIHEFHNEKCLLVLKQSIQASFWYSYELNHTPQIAFRKEQNMIIWSCNIWWKKRLGVTNLCAMPLAFS